jgi:hypothetical protein
VVERTASLLNLPPQSRETRVHVSRRRRPAGATPAERETHGSRIWTTRRPRRRRIVVVAGQRFPAMGHRAAGRIAAIGKHLDLSQWLANCPNSVGLVSTAAARRLNGSPGRVLGERAIRGLSAHPGRSPGSTDDRPSSLPQSGAQALSPRRALTRHRVFGLASRASQPRSSVYIDARGGRNLCRSAKDLPPRIARCPLGR